MRTVLNILNFVLGGFATTLSWLLATLVSVVLIFTLPLTRVAAGGLSPLFIGSGRAVVAALLASAGALSVGAFSVPFWVAGAVSAVGVLVAIPLMARR